MLRRLSTLAATPPPSPMPSAATAQAALPAGPVQPPTWRDLSQRLTQHLQSTMGQAGAGGTAQLVPSHEPADRSPNSAPATTPDAGPTPAR